jgi:hypothetical protein
VIADEAASPSRSRRSRPRRRRSSPGTSTTLRRPAAADPRLAEFSVSYALAAERQAVATYDQTLGTTLERYHVKLADD